MHALITNDDGVGSAGIRTLVQAAVAAGLDATVAAPHEERSGSSAALSALEEDGRLLVDRTTVGDLDALAVHATPAMIVFVALRGAFGEPPDIVLSGVNHGPNSGQAVLHSGTVGAALTAASLGVPGMAVSLVGSSPSHWDTARVVTDAALAWFVRHATRPYVLNVNVPDVPVADLRGLRPTTALAGFGAVQAEIGDRDDGYVTMTFAEIADEAEPDTDVAWLRQNWATATALQPPSPDPSADLSGLDLSGLDLPELSRPRAH